MGMKQVWVLNSGTGEVVSVLNREPMGMKLDKIYELIRPSQVSVLNREPMGMKLNMLSGWLDTAVEFQCSTASRWG